MSSNDLLLDEYLSTNWDIKEQEFRKFTAISGKSEFVKTMEIFFFSNKRNAKEGINRLYELDSSYKYFQLAKARIYELSGRKDEAELIIQQQLKIYPVDKWFSLYAFILDDSDYSLIDSLINNESEFYRARITKAFTLDNLSNCKEIIELLEGIPKKETNYQALTYLAESYYACKNFNMAKILANNALELKENPESYLILGLLDLHVSKNLSAAEHNFLSGLKLEKDYESIMLAMGWLKFEQSNLEMANKYFARVLKQGPKSEATYEDIIRFYLKSNMYDKAKRNLSLAIDKFGRSYITAGIELIIKSHDNQNAKIPDMLVNYQMEFGEDSYLWLLDLIEDINN